MNLLQTLQGATETERLVLRRWRSEDLKPYSRIVSDPEVMLLTGVKPMENTDEAAKELERDIRSDWSFAITLKESKEVIGRIKFHRDMHRFHVNSLSVSYELLKEFWGMGYMTEALKAMIVRAFEKEKADVIGIDHYAENARSRRVIEKCGFKYEGTIHCAVRRFDGKVMDDVCYYYTREDYLERKKNKAV